MDRFARRVAPNLAADSAPQPVEVAAAAATAESTADASELGGLPTVRLNLNSPGP